jgi:collagenase-like PrtC family protease
VERFSDPVEFIRAPWIRPEDVGAYEEIGIDCFKIAERSQETSWILRAANAYASRKYDGDLLDIINFPEGLYRFILSQQFPQRDLPDRLKPVIDNRKLDGFLEFFRENTCRDRSCDDCGYCERVAEKVLTVDNPEIVADGFTKAVDAIISGPSAGQ